jgi:nucleoside diphosphate kinase
MLGETNPADSKPGTIRGDFCVQVCTLNVSDPDPLLLNPDPLFPGSGSSVMLGETNPADSKPGTIRGDFCVQVICTAR